jgi:hypothetical protein
MPQTWNINMTPGRSTLQGRHGVRGGCYTKLLLPSTMCTNVAFCTTTSKPGSILCNRVRGAVLCDFGAASRMSDYLFVKPLSPFIDVRC